MTSDRDLKRLIRARAARTGESYQAARRQLVGERPDDLQAVEQYFVDWQAGLRAHHAATGSYRFFPGVTVPVAAMQAAALAHPNARTRRNCLHVLDHHANDASMSTFRRALADPVPRVRLAALHGLGCDRCKADPDAHGDITPIVRGLATADPSPKVRHAALVVLSRTASDPRVRGILTDIATADEDPLVRDLAARILRGDGRLPSSRKSLRRRTRPAEAAG